MRTVVVTDGKYRASIAAVRSLARAGYAVVVTQTEADCPRMPPVFFSRYAAETKWIDGSAKEEDYVNRLETVLRAYERPILLCVGADSLRAVSRNAMRLAALCDFLVSPPEVLDALNDKQAVHDRAAELGIPVPRQYDGVPEAYPVVLKPHCGEAFGLKAAQRYRIARTEAEYRAALEVFAPYDKAPIVQEKAEGPGIGASLLLGKDGRLLCALCHRRIREYPIQGGPSACCESFYDESLIRRSYDLLRSFGFTGLAMVEWKGDRLLEVNPRIWGSFPLTEWTESPMAAQYAREAAGEDPVYTPGDYKTGVRMRFFLSDAAATASLLLHGRISAGLTGIADLFRAKEAIFRREDVKPFWRYLRR